MKMNSPNESVIILDSPETKRVISKKGTTGGKKPVTRSDTVKTKSLGVEGVRTPLGTVQKGHEAQGTTGSGDVILLTTKRKRDSTDSLSPRIQKKGRKSIRLENGNESIIILSEDDEIQAPPDAPGPSGIIPPLIPNSKGLENVSGVSQVAWQSRRQKRRQYYCRVIKPIKEQTKKKKKKQKQMQPDNEELKILWTSGGIPKSFSNPRGGNNICEIHEKAEIEKQEKKDGNESFFIDVVGDTSLHQVESLNPDNGSIEQKVVVEKKKKEEGKKKEENKKELREIIIDGCNVAMAHNKSHGFSEKGLQIVLHYFVKRGHKVTIFIPQHRRSHKRQLLEVWNREGIVVFTPSRKVGNKSITPYDDRFIVDYANKCKGIIVSSDQFRDLWKEKPEWRETIEHRLLAPTFVGDYLMFPEDPLGQYGPKLDDFLKF